MSFYLVSKGEFKNLEKFIERMEKNEIFAELDKYGRAGVDALRSMTPVDTGITANSWSYNVALGRDETRIIWSNTNINQGVNIAIILQFGHGTGTGGYVQGRDYINPAVQPTMDHIARNVWEAVKRA